MAREPEAAMDHTAVRTLVRGNHGRQACGDGGAGQVSFGGDQNTKPDAKGRKEHRSGTVGNEPSVNLIVQLEKNPFVRGQDSASNATKAPLVTQMSLVTPCETDSACTGPQSKGGVRAILRRDGSHGSSRFSVNGSLEAVRKSENLRSRRQKGSFADAFKRLEEFLALGPRNLMGFWNAGTVPPNL